MTRKKFCFNTIVYTTLFALLIRLFFVEVDISENADPESHPLLASRYFIGVYGILLLRYSWLFHGLGDMGVYRTYQFILLAYCWLFISILPLFNDFVLFDYGSLLKNGYYSTPGQYSDDGNITKNIIKNVLYSFGFAVFQFKTYWFAVTFIIGFGGGPKFRDIINNWSAGTMWYGKKRHGALDGKLYAGNKVIVIEELEGKI